MEHGGGHECRGRVPRRERVVTSRVGTRRLDRVFEAVDQSGHDGDGECVGREHAPPRTVTFYPAYFQPEHECGRGILQVVVVFIPESGYIGVTQVVDWLFGPFKGNAAYH